MVEARRRRRRRELSAARVGGNRHSVAIAEALDRFEIAVGDIDIADASPVHDNRAEPSLAATPFFIEFDETPRLDPDRIGLIWELPPAKTRPIRLRSPLVSLAIHFLPLLALISWPNATADLDRPIPVQLVFEQPPPPPPPQPAPTQAPPPPAQPPQGRLSSVDQGDVKPKEVGTTTSQAPPAASDPLPNPTETQTATAAPTPPLPIPKPAPPKQKSAFQLPKPAGAAVPHHDQTPHEAPRAAQFAGPTASRDDYLAYLVTLTRQHIDLLPMSVIGERRGETVISVVIHENGAIGPLSVLHGSGYPDIDQRIEQMVAAVRRAPPLPQWFQGNAMELVFTLKFPEALYLR